MYFCFSHPTLTLCRYCKRTARIAALLLCLNTQKRELSPIFSKNNNDTKILELSYSFAYTISRESEPSGAWDWTATQANSVLPQAGMHTANPNQQSHRLTTGNVSTGTNPTDLKLSCHSGLVPMSVLEPHSVVTCHHVSVHQHPT